MILAGTFTDASRTTNVAAEQQGQIRIAFERIVNGGPLRAEGAGGRGAAHVVRDHNGLPVGIGLQDLVAPGQHRRVGVHVVFEIQHNEIQAAGAEQIIMIVVVLP